MESELSHELVRYWDLFNLPNIELLTETIVLGIRVELRTWIFDLLSCNAVVCFFCQQISISFVVRSCLLVSGQFSEFDFGCPLVTVPWMQLSIVYSRV